MLRTLAGGRRVLLAAATAREARAVLAGLGADPARADREWQVIPVDARFDVVVTGVGKGNAAGGVARCADADRHAGVVSVGVAGALPGSGLGPLDTVVAEACVYADEGVEMPEGFRTLAALGFGSAPGIGERFEVGPAWREALAQAAASAGVAAAIGAVATVSTCAGTDARAAWVVARTGALAEAMEGAAAAQAASRLGLAFGELRVVSNTTGERAAQRWDLPGALERLRAVIGGL